ncbi:hypothetical protein B0H16DRAFT_1473416 [Mycena metata]|uniref:Uncharacterized protein n=1 Tax=Mycena metata TaxID=1033252 RepID=A0AAD7MKX8_9AGAR|nr:hypothetical protein B0H16DRAFT_1473416 [Mycena metata]
MSHHNEPADAEGRDRRQSRLFSNMVPLSPPTNTLSVHFLAGLYRQTPVPPGITVCHSAPIRPVMGMQNVPGLVTTPPRSPPENPVRFPVTPHIRNQQMFKDRVNPLHLLTENPAGPISYCTSPLLNFTDNQIFSSSRPRISTYIMHWNIPLVFDQVQHRTMRLLPPEYCGTTRCGGFGVYAGELPAKQEVIAFILCLVVEDFLNLGPSASSKGGGKETKCELGALSETGSASGRHGESGSIAEVKREPWEYYRRSRRCSLHGRGELRGASPVRIEAESRQGGVCEREAGSVWWDGGAGFG